MNTKTVFISECEREHILKGLRTGLQVKRKYYSGNDPSQDLVVVLDKLGLLHKNLDNMERTDIMKYECLRKKMKEVRCNAKQLLQSDDISINEMREIIKNLNRISKKMKEMSAKLGTDRFVLDETLDSVASDHSNISIKRESKKVISQSEEKKKNIAVSPNACGSAKSTSEQKKQKSKTQQGREETKCVSQSKLANIFKDQDCSVQSDDRPTEQPNFKGSYVTKYSKSNDHQHHCYEGLVVETCSKCLCKRWSIPSVNRTTLKSYIKKNIKNTGHKVNSSNGSKNCVHSFGRSRQLSKKDDFVALPGLVPHERKHLTAVRNKILKDNVCDSKAGILNAHSSSGCCFNSNSELEVFETSDTSLTKNEDEWNEIFESCSQDYKGEALLGYKNYPASSAEGAIQWDGERAQVNGTSNVSNIKAESSKEIAGNKESPIDVRNSRSSVKVICTNKCSERIDKGVQSSFPKVSQATSYDNFVLHPQFSWSMPMIGQAFRRTIPLTREKWRYFDKCGKFVRPCQPSTDIGTTTKKPRHTLVSEKSAQTNDMLFTKNMHQVMYLNVVYTKTHLRYIVPNSMEIPVLPQTPKVIERRAIDNGYAVTTYKADPDGVIHFTLAYSDGNECKKDESNALPSETNQRLSQLKNLWVSSARKFFSQLNEKLVGESGDCQERYPWANSINCSSTYTSSSLTQSDTSEGSTNS